MEGKEFINARRIFTIVPITGMEVIQKNFASYGQDGVQSAENFVQSKKVFSTSHKSVFAIGQLTLARRFQLMERGYVLQMIATDHGTMLKHAEIEIILGKERAATNETTHESTGAEATHPDDDGKENEEFSKQ